jgi:ABC-type branched-subunit amino acid transport system ATPase component
MNPVDRRQLLGQIRQWADVGTTVIIVEHQLGALAEIADRLVALDRGVVVADGLPAQVLASEDIIRRLIQIEYHRGGTSDQ